MDWLGKRKYYKKWWFWILGILLTVFFMMSPSELKTVDTSQTGMISTPQIIKPGTYKAGEDIKVGKYILVSDKPISAKIIRHLLIFNSEAYQTKGFTREAIIINNDHYLTIETENCMIYPAASAPKAEIKDGKLNPGVYLVGTDIPAGKYDFYRYSFEQMEIIYESNVTVYRTSSYSFSGKTQIYLIDGHLVYVPKDPITITPYSQADETPSLDYEIFHYNLVGNNGIKPGEYVLVPRDGIYSYDISFESSKDPDSFETNSRSYITLVSGQSVDFDGCKVYTLENAPKVEIIDGKLPEGMYKIGTDISAGTYTLVSKTNEQGKYYIANDSKHLNTKYNNFEGSLSVDVKTGQYLYVENGYILVN